MIWKRKGLGEIKRAVTAAVSVTVVLDIYIFIYICMYIRDVIIPKEFIRTGYARVQTFYPLPRVRDRIKRSKVRVYVYTNGSNGTQVWTSFS